MNSGHTEKIIKNISFISKLALQLNSSHDINVHARTRFGWLRKQCEDSILDRRSFLSENKGNDNSK